MWTTACLIILENFILKLAQIELGYGIPMNWDFEGTAVYLGTLGFQSCYLIIKFSFLRIKLCFGVIYGGIQFISIGMNHTQLAD